MPLKKKLFRSNMLFLFLSMVTLLLIGTAVIGACEDRFERTFEEIGYEKMDGDVWDISKDIGKEAIRESFSFLVLIVLVVGIIAILALLLLASIFTKRMNRLVMEPLDCLVEGAKRIQDGNLEEEIVYEGQEEFERVCRAFNEMQRTILEDQKIRERNEKARTDMVTGISHDLRTPLTSIRGYIKGFWMVWQIRKTNGQCIWRRPMIYGRYEYLATEIVRFLQNGKRADASSYDTDRSCRICTGIHSTKRKDPGSVRSPACNGTGRRDPSGCQCGYRADPTYTGEPSGEQQEICRKKTGGDLAACQKG